MPISTTTPCGSSSLWKICFPSPGWKTSGNGQALALAAGEISPPLLDLRIQPELLEEVAGEALQHLNRRSAEYPIRVDIEDDLLMAKMDSRLITQVIINIVNNAVKYTPPGTDITLSARREGDTVRVEIADTGPGIPQEAQGRLFQMFYTAGNDRGDGRRGLGLGLALCKSIVEAHGGEIGMRANEPHGSVFFFTLQAEEIKL